MTTYAKRRSAGLCGHCGKVAPEGGKASCRACLDRIRSSSNARNRERVAAGRCPTCDREGYTPRQRRRQMEFKFGAAA